MQRNGGIGFIKIYMTLKMRDNMEEWKEIKPWEEALRSEDREYTNTEAEQAVNMQRVLGSALDRKLEIMAAKLEIINYVKAKCERDIELVKRWISSDSIAASLMLSCQGMLLFLKNLEQEIKAELK